MTEKTNSELVQELAASQKIFKMLVDSVHDYAIFMLDANGNILTWNEGAQAIKGYTADDIIGKHFSTFYTEEANARKHPQYELEVAKREGRYEEEGWRVKKDGTMFWANVLITAVYDDTGQLIGFAKVTRDLTERKKAQAESEIFRLLVSGVRDYAIFMLDRDGNIITWNDGAKRIQGYENNEIVGKHFSIFYTKEAQKRKHPQYELQVAAAEGRYEEEGWRVRKDGSLLWASVVITAIQNEGELIGYAKVTRDLTQRLLADQEREMSAQLLDQTNTELRAALDVKSRFLSTISHEVRTPMSAIIGMTEMLSLEDLGPDNNAVVQSIFDSSKRLLQLLNNLVEAARMEAGDLATERHSFPLRTAVGDVRQLVTAEAAKKKLSINGTFDARIPEKVVGDEIKVRQILLNLAHNAVKFTDVGRVDISAEFLGRIRDQVRIRFTVTDTGLGITPEEGLKLFKPFAQANDSTKRIYGGSGLGLSISKQLVEALGGKIDFESTPGIGSRFWFELPFESPEESL